jgi:hypothetical protein
MSDLVKLFNIFVDEAIHAGGGCFLMKLFSKSKILESDKTNKKQFYGCHHFL